MKALKFPLQVLFSAALATALLGGTAWAQSAALKKADGVMVDAAGMTVYTFDKDTAGSGKSTCNGPCATAWPPIPASGSPAAPFSSVKRDDGSAQLAYKGKPLYLFASDKKPGDRTGDNVKDVWHVVKD